MFKVEIIQVLKPKGRLLWSVNSSVKPAKAVKLVKDEKIQVWKSMKFLKIINHESKCQCDCITCKGGKTSKVSKNISIEVDV